MAQFLAAAPAVLSAVATGSQLIDKYAPKIRGLANNLFSKRKRHSAMHYIKNLATPKGLKKLFNNDIGHVAKEASKFISSGKLLKGIKNVSGDLNDAVSAAAPLMGDRMSQSVGNALNKAENTATHFHDVAHQYNEQGHQLVTQWNKGKEAAE
jgi:hypothetical protein